MRTREQYEAFRKACPPSKLFCFQVHDIQIAGRLLHLTVCNDWAAVRLASLGVPVPAGMLAAQIWSWLGDARGGGAAWLKVDELTAKQRVETYQPVIIIWPNLAGDHGHIAVGEPAPDVLPHGTTHGDLFCSAAGAVNVDCLPWRRSFGSDKDAQVEFWTTDN